MKHYNFENHCSFLGINLTKPSKGLFDGVIDLLTLNETDKLLCLI